MKQLNKLGAPLLSAVLLCAACGSIVAADATRDDPAIGESVANTTRPEKDRARDSQRLPAAVLAFFDIRAGQHVLDMYSGGGYYTELVSRIVGPSGSVTAHNNTAYAGMSASERGERYADGRLANVTELIEGDGGLTLPENAFDRVLFVLSYHDVYYLDGQRGWKKVDRKAMLDSIFRATRKGGIVGVIDHVAAADATAETLPQLHRINPEVLKQDFIAAGFTLIDSSDILANPQDDLAVMPMLPTNRGKSDRFVLKFRKP